MTSTASDYTHKYITLPVTYTHGFVPIANTGVGGSGWQYLNGVMSWANTNSTLQIDICCGVSSNMPVHYITIGY